MWSAKREGYLCLPACKFWRRVHMTPRELGAAVRREEVEESAGLERIIGIDSIYIEDMRKSKPMESGYDLAGSRG